VFELVSTVLAGPHVSNAMIRQMLGLFWCNNSSTTLRTLDDWPVIHGDPSDVPDTKQKSILKLSRNRAQTIAKLLSFCANASQFWHVTGVTRCFPKTLDERSALPPKADIRHRELNVRFVPEGDIIGLRHQM
jgi:hypothetical protein